MLSKQINASASTNVMRGGVYNFGVTLNAGALGDDIVWSVSNPLYATVDSSGTVAILNKTGMAVLSATDPASGLSHSIVLRIV